ncbi:hypothetical protein BH23BAC4_BH23BAC4_07870 [soil metagenome]
MRYLVSFGLFAVVHFIALMGAMWLGSDRLVISLIPLGVVVLVVAVMRSHWLRVHGTSVAALARHAGVALIACWLASMLGALLYEAMRIGGLDGWALIGRSISDGSLLLVLCIPSLILGTILGTSFATIRRRGADAWKTS